MEKCLRSAIWILCEYNRSYNHHKEYLDLRCLPIALHLCSMLSSDIVLRDRCERWQRWCQWKWWFCYGARQNCKQTAHKNWMVSKMPFHFHDHVVQFSLGSMIILLGMLLAVSSVLFARVHYFFCKHWNHFVYVHLICSFVCLVLFCLFVFSILCFRTLAHSHAFAFPMSLFLWCFFR